MALHVDIYIYVCSQCLQNHAKKIYWSLPRKPFCADVTRPCWIPAAQGIIPKAVANLSACKKFEELNCMIGSLKLGMKDVTTFASRSRMITVKNLAVKYDLNNPCQRACKEVTYKITAKKAGLTPFKKV